MKFKRSLLATSALLAAAIGTSAYAQSGTSVSTIEELVVTAEKREASLQDVPVAISAFTAERRDLVGINSIQDMTNFTPGMTYSTATDRVSVRGVGRLTNVLTGDAAIANYNDGVYESFAVQAGRSTLFLDRVEVLRGPQGTLYGRNAIGGALNQISKRPTDEWYAEVRGKYENYESRTLEGAVSGPLLGMDNMQFRLAGSWIRQTQGWIDNVVPGMPDEGGIRNELFFEAQLQGKFFDDKFEFWAKAGAGQWHNGAGGPGSQSGGWTNAPYPTYEFGPSGIQLNAGYGCNPTSGTTNVVNVSPLGCANPMFSGSQGKLSKDAARSVARVVPYEVRLPIYNTIAGHFTFHAKDFDVKYVTGGVNYHYKLSGPTSTAGGSLSNGANTPITFYRLATGLNVFPQETFDYREYNRFWSHEINIVSTWDSPVQYVVGAYLFNQDVRQPVSTALSQQAQFNGPFGLPSVFCSASGGVCAPETGFHLYDNRPSSTAKSYAFFGQADWKVTEQFKLTGGLRYSHDNKQGTERVRLICFGTPTCGLGAAELYGPGGPPPTDITIFAVSNPPVGTPLPGGITTRTTVNRATGLAERSYDASWSAVTGTAGVEWTPDEDTLVYGKYSKGYKSGGFYVGIFTFLAPEALAEKEIVDSFEIGLKKDIGRTLQTNFAAYYYNYSNLQVPISVFNVNGLVSTNFYNVPKAISQGFEAEITWLPIDNMRVLFSYSYNDAYISRGTALDIADPGAIQPGAKPLTAAALCSSAPTRPCDRGFTNIIQRSQSLKGNTLPNAPKHKLALNVNYTWASVMGGDLVGSASYVWRDTQYGNIFERSYNKAPTWDQVDLRFTWTSEDASNRIIVFGKNILDSLGHEAGAIGARYAGFNVNAAGVAVPQLMNRGIPYSTYQVTPPRTYGIEIQHKFW